jgi:thiamine-phosphate pyrophosphorylase
MVAEHIGAERRARLADARLYLVCPERPAQAPEAARGLPELVRAAVAGGVDIVQLREKHAGDEAQLPLANDLARLCEDLGALFIVNDSPRLARDARADGVHVGQDDIPVAEARAIVGPDMLVGLSTHARAEVDAAAALAADGSYAVDYIAVGPVHETPTKAGRPAAGIDLVTYAAAHARVPFFAIGGLHAGNLREVLDSGATRAVILRAIADAEDPEQAARAVRAQLDAVGAPAHS